MPHYCPTTAPPMPHQCPTLVIRWTRFALLSAGGILVFTLGIPYLLYRAARSVCGTGAAPSADAYDYYSLLFVSYKQQFWYFESVDLLRKLLNTSIVAVVMQGTDVQIWFSALCAWISLFAYTLLQPYADPLCNGLQLIALLHLAITHLSATLFISTAFIEYPRNLGLIMVVCTFAVLAAAAAVLLRNVGSLLSDALHLERADGTPVLLHPPDVKDGYHVFLSHCWRFGQDQAATLKAMITLMLPGCRAFLDVDNLKSIALLETHVAESDVVCIFLTRSFITSANCLRELVATVAHGKRLCVVVETDDNKGAPTAEDLQLELEQLRSYGTPEQISAAEHRKRTGT